MAEERNPIFRCEDEIINLAEVQRMYWEMTTIPNVGKQQNVLVIYLKNRKRPIAITGNRAKCFWEYYSLMANRFVGDNPDEEAWHADEKKPTDRPLDKERA